jgi:hypothetical protein
MNSFFSIKNALSSSTNSFTVYKYRSESQKNFFTAIVQNWLNVKGRRALEYQYAQAMQSVIYGTNGANIIANSSALVSSVTTIGRYVSSSQAQFSRVFFRLSTSDTNMEILPINIQNTGGVAITSRSAAVTSNYIYKIREIFVTSMISSLSSSGFEELEKIINNGWTAKLSTQPAIKSTLQNNVFTSSVSSVDRYLTSKNQFVFKIEYTISISNRDPEYLGISEPTNDQLQTAFSSTSVKLCNCFGVENIRIYINSLKTADQNSLTIINNLVLNLWNQQNPSYPISSRLNFSLSVNSSYYSSTGSPLTRIDLAWIMDSDNPNPIFFNVPTAYNVTQTLKSVNIVPYTDIPYQIYTIYLTNFDSSKVNQIALFVSTAWSSTNNQFKASDFVVNVMQQSSSAKAASTSR